MGNREIPCDIDNFAEALESLIGDIPPAVNERVGEAVAHSTREGAKMLREQYASGGRHPWSDEYRKGFTSHVDGKGAVTTGEIGNKNKPGLVHLLEKGHATLTGRRTNAYPHMAPAFEEMKEKFVKEVEDAVGRALEG